MRVLEKEKRERDSLVIQWFHVMLLVIQMRDLNISIYWIQKKTGEGVSCNDTNMNQQIYKWFTYPASFATSGSTCRGL